MYQFLSILAPSQLGFRGQPGCKYKFCLFLLSNSIKPLAIDYKQRLIRKGKREVGLVRNAEIPVQLLRGLYGLIELIYLAGH